MKVCARRGSGRKSYRNLYLLVAFVLASISGCSCGGGCHDCVYSFLSGQTNCYSGVCTAQDGTCLVEEVLQSDVSNCGSCGHACAFGETCTGGVCTVCSGGIVCLNNSRVYVCIDPNTNPSFCGATGDCAGYDAGRECGLNCTCVSGMCAAPAGLVRCDGNGCIDPNSDVNFCGASGDCTGANAGTSCYPRICDAGVCS